MNSSATQQKRGRSLRRVSMKKPLAKSGIDFLNIAINYSCFNKPVAYPFLTLTLLKYSNFGKCIWKMLTHYSKSHIRLVFKGVSSKQSVTCPISIRLLTRSCLASIASLYSVSLRPNVKKCSTNRRKSCCTSIVQVVKQH
jgi:hypothetical protein